MNILLSPEGFLHASAVLLDEHGILIIGTSGAGKSALAGRVIAEAASRGRFAMLIGDDRIGITTSGGRLIARPHKAVRGRIEQRGIGLLAMPHIESAVVGGIVALEPEPARLPDPEAKIARISGIALPLLRLRMDENLASRAHLVLAWARR